MSGLPSGESALILVNGPSHKDKLIETSTTLSDLQPGDYTLSAKAIKSLLGFVPQQPTQTASVVAGQTAQVNFNYQATLGALEYSHEGLLLGEKPTLFLSAPGGLLIEQAIQTNPMVLSLTPGQYSIADFSLSPNPPQVGSEKGFFYKLSAAKTQAKTIGTLKVDAVVRFTIKAGETTPLPTVFTPTSGSLDITFSGVPAGAKDFFIVGDLPINTSSIVNYLKPQAFNFSARNIESNDITYQPQSPPAQVTIEVGKVIPMAVSYKAIDSRLQVNISGIGDPNANKPVRLVGPGFNSGSFGSSKTFAHLAPGSYTLSAAPFTTGDPGKPSCRNHLPNSAVQNLNLAAGLRASLSISYTAEPCDAP